MKCSSFAPIADENSKILILGSMPGKKSLAMQQYYAHKQNRFWKLLAELFAETEPETYAAKLRLLSARRIALWDTLAFCERESSADSDIKNETPNDIAGLLNAYPQICAVFCNGGKAAAAYKKYCAPLITRQVDVYYLPSTSPANARMNLNALKEKWSLLLRYL